MTLHRVMPLPQDYGNEEQVAEQCRVWLLTVMNMVDHNTETYSLWSTMMRCCMQKSLFVSKVQQLCSGWQMNVGWGPLEHQQCSSTIYCFKPFGITEVIKNYCAASEFTQYQINEASVITSEKHTSNECCWIAARVAEAIKCGRAFPLLITYSHIVPKLCLKHPPINYYIAGWNRMLRKLLLKPAWGAS